MQDYYDRNSVHLVQHSNEVNYFQMMTETKKCDGYIEEHEPRLLPKGQRNPCLLPLSARQS